MLNPIGTGSHPFIDLDMTQIELIRQEIERLKEGNRNIRCQHNEKYCIGYDDAFNDLLSFIDSLEEKDLIVINKKEWEAQEQFRKNKDFGKPLQQEQSKVDLDESIKDFLLNNSEFLVKRDSKAVVQKLSRHFYELGLKVGKEERK